jgi:serine/threonine-protein phosphatase 2A regulatory subunit B''
LYWKGILFGAAGGEKTGLLSYVAFSDFWRKMVATHHDEAAQFMHILNYRNNNVRRNLLSPEDFVPLVQDVVDTHPGLGFLKEATEFHSRYVHTVSPLLTFSCRK